MRSPELVIAMTAIRATEATIRNSQLFKHILAACPEELKAKYELGMLSAFEVIEIVSDLSLAGLQEDFPKSKGE